MSKKKHRRSGSGTPNNSKAENTGNNTPASINRSTEKDKASLGKPELHRAGASSPTLLNSKQKYHHNKAGKLNNSITGPCPSVHDPWRSLSDSVRTSSAKHTKPSNDALKSKAWSTGIQRPKLSMRPTPLSPPFPINPPTAVSVPARTSLTKTTIAVPTDHKSNSGWMTQQMEMIRKRTAEKPSFSASATQTDGSDGDGDGDDEKKKKKKRSREDKDTNGESASKPKRDKKKASAGEGKTPQPSQLPTVESPNAAERRSQANAKRREREAKKKQALKDTVDASASVDKKKRAFVPGARASSLQVKPKRKFDEMNSAEAFNLRLYTEAQAIKRLREALPVTKLTVVSQRLERECGTEPNQMAVLVEAARETIVDLARGQMSATIGAVGRESLGGEILRMLKQQAGRIEKLESASVEQKRNDEIESENGGSNHGKEVPADEDSSSETEAQGEFGHGNDSQVDENDATSSSSDNSSDSDSDAEDGARADSDDEDEEEDSD